MREVRTNGRAALTLIELLVVIGIIAILIALILSVVTRVRASAMKAACANNLRQIGLAIHHYHDTHKYLPSYRSYRSTNPDHEKTVWCLILPYVEQQNVYDAGMANGWPQVQDTAVRKWVVRRRQVALDELELRDPVVVAR